MPRLVHTRPKYRQHRASKQAIVEVSGRVHYLGPYGSQSSHEQYERLVTAWIKQGRPADFQFATDQVGATPRSPAPQPQQPDLERKTTAIPPADGRRPGELKIVQLIARFWRHAKSRYQSYGRRTGTHENYRPVLRLLRGRYGKHRVSEFGPLALQSLRDDMIRKGNSRRYVNDNVDRVRRVFKWGVSQEVVPAGIPQALAAVECVHEGAVGVVEHAPIEPVAEQIVSETLRFLPAVIADMVQLQLLTASRPGEICILRPVDVDRSDDLWIYRPQYHKTEHHGKKRHIVIGPRAQKILEPYLKRAPNAHCFSPAESQSQMMSMRRNRRKSPMTPSQAARKPKDNSCRAPGNRYTNDSYRRSIARACDKAFPPPEGLTQEEKRIWREEHRWSPNQLRHTAATKICDQFESLLVAKETLGHSTIRVTEGYAKPTLRFAKRAMRELG